jgi:hypothetical protein
MRSSSSAALYLRESLQRASSKEIFLSRQSTYEKNLVVKSARKGESRNLCTAVYGGVKPKIQRLSVSKITVKDEEPIKTELLNNGCQTDPEIRNGWC